MTTYAIGDVQGCFKELLQLLEFIAFQPNQDELWFVGDLVNRGPDSLNVLRFVKSLGHSAKVVLGNHDLHVLAIAAGVRPKDSELSLKPILDAPDCDELLTWLKTQPLIYYDANLRYLLVHAGLPPQWGLAEALEHGKTVSDALQGPNFKTVLKNMYGNAPTLWTHTLSRTQRLRFTINALTRIRFCNPAGKLKLNANVKMDWEHPKPNLIPWFLHPKRKSESTYIIFGHWAALGGITFDPKIQALDTGCVWGGFLTALRLTDGLRFAVPNQTS